MPSEVGDGDKWKGPLKKIVSPLTAEIIIANKVRGLRVGAAGWFLGHSRCVHMSPRPRHPTHALTPAVLLRTHRTS